MLIKRNLKNFIKRDFPWYGFDYRQHVKENSRSIRKEFLKSVSQTFQFACYDFRCELINLRDCIVRKFTG